MVHDGKFFEKQQGGERCNQSTGTSKQAQLSG